MAVINANKALEKQPDLDNVHRALSLIYLLQGKFKESRDFAGKALKLKPDDEETYYLMWRANGSNDLPAPIKNETFTPLVIKKHCCWLFFLAK